MTFGDVRHRRQYHPTGTFFFSTARKRAPESKRTKFAPANDRRAKFTENRQKCPSPHLISTNSSATISTDDSARPETPIVRTAVASADTALAPPYDGLVSDRQAIRKFVPRRTSRRPRFASRIFRQLVCSAEARRRGRQTTHINEREQGEHGTTISSRRPSPRDRFARSSSANGSRIV